MANEKKSEEQPKQRKPLTGQAWKDAFEAFKEDVKSRDHIYPEGYDVETSRAVLHDKNKDDQS